MLDPRRPWLEAGRSTDAVRRSARATRLSSGRWWERLVERTAGEPGEERRLRRQVAAARATARVLEPLRAQGWVVLHDRAVAGTGAVADHLLVGPFGLVLLGNHPTVSLQLAFGSGGMVVGRKRAGAA